MRLRVHLALLSVQLFFGLWPVLGTLAMRHMPPAALIGFRLALGAPILALAAGLLSRALPSRRDLGLLALSAALGISINQLLFAEGLHRSDPINASVSILLLPSFTLIIAALARVESPSRLRWIGVAIALSGGALLVGAERASLGHRVMLGNLLLLANVTAYAAFLVLARPLFQRTGALPGMAWAFVLGGLECLPVTLPAMLGVDWAGLPPDTWVVLGLILLGPTLGSYALNAYALRRVESSVVALYTNLQPIVATGTAWWLTGAVPSGRTLAAAAIIVAGVTLSTEVWRPALAALRREA